MLSWWWRLHPGEISTTQSRTWSFCCRRTDGPVWSMGKSQVLWNDWISSKMEKNNDFSPFFTPPQKKIELTKVCELVNALNKLRGSYFWRQPQARPVTRTEGLPCVLEISRLKPSFGWTFHTGKVDNPYPKHRFLWCSNKMLFWYQVWVSN